MTPPPQPQPPNLSPVTFFPAQDLKFHPILASSFRHLCNSAFYRSKASDPAKWNNDTLRFPSEDMLHALLTPDSIIAVIFDLDEPAVAAEGQSAETETIVGESGNAISKKIVACAAAVPWKGGWHQEGAGVETGWEIKTVCVDGGAKYLCKGLAVRILGALERRVVDTKRSGGTREVQFWILAAECINGVYWRKREYQEMRRRIEGVGTWSCKTEFEMVVFRKVVGV